MPLLGPEAVAVMPPQGKAGIQDMLASAASGSALHLLPAYDSPYVSWWEAVAQGITMDRLLAKLPVQDVPVLKDAIAGSGHSAADLIAVPILSTRGSATMLLDARTGRIIRRLPLNIWQVFNTSRN